MTYDTERLENKMKRDFTARMELYLNSKSIHEYVVERDIKGLNKYNTRWTDEFVWWYILKDQFGMFIAGIVSAIALSIAVPILLWIAGLRCGWSIATAVALVSLVVFTVVTMIKTVNCLSEKRVDSSIDSSRDYFACVDAKMSSKQMSND